MRRNAFAELVVLIVILALTPAITWAQAQAGASRLSLTAGVRSAAVDTIVVDGSKDVFFLVKTDGINANRAVCNEEVRAHGEVSAEGGFDVDKTVSKSIPADHPWYPSAGSPTTFTYRCYDKLGTGRKLILSKTIVAMRK